MSGVIACAWLLVANAGLLGATHALYRRIRTPNAPVNGILFILLHLLLMSGSVLIGGVSGGLTPAVLGLSGFAVLVLLYLLGEHRHLQPPAPPEIGKWTAILAALIAVRMLAQVWFFAPYTGDVQAYHLPKLAEWVRASRFTPEMGTDLCATFPAGFELIETWWVVFLHHDVLIELAGVEFAVLGVLSVRALALHLGSSQKSSWLAGTLYVLTPLFNLQVTSCLNDAPVASLVISIATLVAVRAHPALLLIPLGLLAGIKATGLLTAPGWILLGVLCRRQPLLRPLSVPVAWAASALSTLWVGAFWYVRNLLWYGNPVYPVHGYGLLHDLNDFNVQTGPELGSLYANLSRFVSSSLYDREPLMALATHTAGWGAIGFSIGMVALISLMRKDRGFLQVGSAFCLATLSVFLMVRHDFWYARFVLFGPAILCIAAAKFSESVRSVRVLLTIGVILEFASTMLPMDIPPAKMAAIARQPWRQRSAAVLPPDLPETAPLGVFSVNRTMTYFMYGPALSRRVVYLRVSSPEDLAAMMEREGVSYVYVNLSRRAQYLFMEFVKQGRFRPLGGGYFVLVQAPAGSSK